MLKQFEKADALDSIVKAREEEARDLADIGVRMQHNIDLLGKMNNNLREQLTLKEGQNVDCKKSLEVYQDKVKRKNALLVIFGVGLGAALIDIAAH